MVVLGCGGGGKSTEGSNLPQTSAPPTVALAGYTPNDAQLLQYKAYTYSASASDPNIGGSITEIDWDFGDGTKKVTPVVLANGKATATCTYAYLTSGSPTLSVVAKNGAGLLSTAVTKALTVAAAPSPLTVTLISPTGPISVNTSLGISYALAFQIHIANSGTGTISASSFLLDPGEATATQATPVDLGNGDWRIVVTYQAAASAGSRTVNPTLRVVDSTGSSSDLLALPALTVKTLSSVNNPPVITLVATPKLPVAANSTWQNTAIDFLATASDPDGDTMTYTWTFGDGGKGDVASTTQASALSQSHTFVAVGVYPVVFTANDGRGGVKSITLNLNILANAAPVVQPITVLPSGPAYANVPLTFSAVVTDANGDVPSVTWDFGDTTTGKDSPITHSFAAAGSTTIRVTADDGKGGVTAQTLTLTVLTNRPPVSAVTTPPGNLNQNRAYTFTAKATDPDAGDTIAQYQWDFGDGTAIQNSATSTIAHTYASSFSGAALVKVRAVDNHGSVGDFSPGVTFTVQSTSLPVVTFVSPAAAQTSHVSAAAGSTVVVSYVVSATNPNGTGFLPLSALASNFDPGDPTGQFVASKDNKDGTYVFQYKYGPSATASRKITPSLFATDLSGISGLPAAPAAITIQTMASGVANLAPGMTTIPFGVQFLSTPPDPTVTLVAPGTNATWAGVPIIFSSASNTNLVNVNDPDNDPLTVTWDFGDGTPPVTTYNNVNTVPTVSHTYATDGYYTVKLTVDDGRENGVKWLYATPGVTVLSHRSVKSIGITTLPPPYIAWVSMPFTSTVLGDDGQPYPAYVRWDMGDLFPATNTTNYAADLAVLAGLFPKLTAPWNLYSKGPGSTSSDPATEVAGQPVTLNTLGNSVNWFYPPRGLTHVVATAYDGMGGVVTSAPIDFNVGNGSGPTASIITPSATLYTTVPAQFAASAVTVTGLSVANYVWDFGDGSPVLVTTTNTAFYAYTKPGTWQVRVYAVDNAGNIGPFSTSVAFTVVLALPPSSAGLTIRGHSDGALVPPSGTLYQNKRYDFIGSATPGTFPIDHYVFDYGDGTTDSLGYHTYAPAFTGTVNVAVQAVDTHGAVSPVSTPVSFSVVATPLPVVTFVSPAVAALNVDSNGTVSQVFTLTATNPRGVALGLADPILTFNPNDALATVTSSVSDGHGNYTVTVKYGGAATTPDTRTNHPSAYATDGLGIQGLSNLNGPAVTVTTLTINHAPSITITDPVSPISSGYTSKPVSLGFTLKDADNDAVTYTVNWGDGTPTSSGVPQGDFVAGVPVSLTHVYADAFTASTQTAVITVDATDLRSTTPNAVTQTRTFTIAFNTLPTASITSPQDSGAAPTGYTPNPLPADTVVVPLNSKLSFAGVSTKPGSQDTVTSTWNFSAGGTPSSFTGDTPGEVFFTGANGVITPYTITFTVTDTFGRSATKQKTVLVDGVNTQLFHLSFVYRQKSDNNGAPLIAPVATEANGLGATVQIFQDHQTNSYAVQNQSQPVGAKALVDIPVRSDLPFYIKLPTFGSDSTSYLMRIPNAPTGPYADPTLGATPGADSAFTFRNASAPFEPALQIVTAQGFAAEASAAPQRKLNGFTNLIIGASPNPANERWLDRLSVPYNDPSGAIQWQQSSNNVGLLNGIPAYQLFAEWPTLIVTRKTGDLADTTPVDPTSASGKSTDLGFVLDYPTYITSPPKPETFAAFSMQIFRVPAGVTDPYQMSPAWQLPNTQLPLPYSGDPAAVDTGSHLGLNPVPVSPAVTTFFNGMVMGNAGVTPLTGGISNFPLPYDPNDPNRTPLVAPTPRGYSGLISVFAYSEYLWSTVWAHPLVLNSARPDGSYSFSPGAFSAYRYSKPALWPKASGISPDNSAFDLTPHGGGVFNAVAPVAVGGPAPSTGVGHFYWTAYTPSYSGDAGTGGVISRTWLADDATQQIPTSFPSGSATGDATVALGFVPPQDAIVDKRGRGATGTLNGSQLGGYRVTWYNPTKDASGNPVPPDFWVVELVDGSAKSHFMLPGSYPAGTQSTADLIMTDARTYLPSGNAAGAGPAAGDLVGPGYCWFDIPVELRPIGGSATLTVFGVKAILKNNPVAGARPLNRPDWIDAIKTATATIKVVAGSGTDLAYAHKIPFNYCWDIVVANGPATFVAP